MAACSVLDSPTMPMPGIFVGQSYLNPVAGQSGVNIANVTFEPGCRNNWHIHKAQKGGGQLLLCTEGRGWYQEWGKEARELHPRRCGGDPCGRQTLAWRCKEQLVLHLAVELPGEDASNEWLEAVNDETYNALE